MKLTREQFLTKFLTETGMSEDRMEKAGIHVEPCPCNNDYCPGWLALNHWQ